MGCKARAYFREAVLKSSLRDGKESPIRKRIKNFLAKSGGGGLMFTTHFPDGAHLAPNPPRNRHLALLYHTDVRNPPSLPLAANLPHAYSLHALQSMPSVRVFHLQGLIPLLQSSWPKPSARSDSCQHTRRPVSCPILS